jgi:tetratricopeptide (TPR) repeat protein
MLRLLALVCLSVAAGLNGVLGTSQAPTSGLADSAETHVGKGYECLKDDRFAAAALEFEAALQIDPALRRARYQLAVCYFALGRRDDARREFEKLQSEAYDPAVTYYLGRIDLVEHHPELSIRELGSVAAHPPFPDTAYYLGAAYLEKGDLASAKRWFKRAEAITPRDFRVPDHLARVDQRLGLPSEAEKEYARSARLHQYYDQAATMVVACSHDLETRPADESRTTCRKLFQPDDPEKLTTLGMIYGQHGDYGEALEPLKRAAELDPDSWEIQHDLGLTCFRLKRYAEARGPLEKAVALRPDFFGSNALLGATLYALQDDEAAYPVLDHAHRLKPEEPESANLLFKVALSLALERYEKKAYAKSLGYLQKASELRPDNVFVQARMAEIRRLLGERSEPRSGDSHN